MAETQEPPISINNIPNEILHKVISLIPLKEAARTIILSSSWKDLWAPIQVMLDLNSGQITSQQSGQRITQIISSFLNTYGISYQTLNLSFLDPNDPNGPNSCNQEQLETLFMKVIKGIDKEVYINFNEEKFKDFSLSIELPLCKKDNFFTIKSLHLRSVIGMAGSFLPELFSGCRNLETLSLEKCIGLQDVDLKAHEFLQKFVIMDCENLKTVTVSSAINLNCFLYRGSLAKIELKEVPKLCDVTLNLKGSNALSDHHEFECEDMVNLLASIKNVEVLTLSGWLAEGLYTRGVSFDVLEFKFDKLKELSWIDCCMNTQKRDSLASFLSITPFLENLCIKIDAKWSTIQHHHFHQSWTQAWTVKLKDFQLKHLKLVKFFGFKIEEENLMLVFLMDLLLKSAIAIKEMSVAEPEKQLSWRVAKIPQSHLKKINPSSKTTSNLFLSLSKNCCFQFTPIHDN